MSPRLNSRWLALAAIGGLAYPFIVYFGLTAVPPSVFVLFGLAVIALRMVGFGRMAESGVWRACFALAALALLGLLLASPAIAVKAYPVAISLSVAAVFGLSLLYPPTVIERLARLSEPDLPAAGIVYTRRVTWVWLGFLLLNAAISAATGLWGTLDQWTLWNGLLSYLAMGLLFAVEFVVRRRVRGAS